MARRPENPKNRGRRSEGPLDWLNEANQDDQPSGPAPAVDDWQAWGDRPAPPADPRARVYPEKADDPFPRVGAGAAAPLSGRRAARAQREALEAEQARSGPARPGPARAERARPEQPPNDQTHIRSNRRPQPPGPLNEPPRMDQTQIGLTWTGPIPAAPTPPAQPVPPAQTRPTRGRGRPGPPPATGEPAAASPWAAGPPHPVPTRGRSRPSDPMPADQTRVGPAWPGPMPQPMPFDGPHTRAQPDPGRAPELRQQQPYPGAGPVDDRYDDRHRFGFDRSDHERDDRDPDDEARDDRSEREPASPRRRQIAIGLTIAGLLLTAWASTAFVDSASFPVAALAGLAPLVSVLALPVIAVGVARKHVVPTAIAAIAALLPWALVPGYAVAGPGQQTVEAGTTLRVMSIDGAEGKASAKDIVQVTRLYAVDVVVITDLTSELTHDLTVAGLNALAPSRWVDVKPGGTHGTGLWARPEINNPTPITGLSQSGVDGVITAGSTNVGISVVHLAGEPLRPGPAWHSDLAELGQRTPPAKDSFIVGDLNAGPWHPAFRKLTGSKWRDAADVVGQGLRPTWPSWSPLPIAPVDHVLASPGLGVAGADTTNIAGSTHRALIVTLVLPNTVADG